MKKNEIKVGGHYRAKVSGKLTTVRVDSIKALTVRGYERDMYYVTNLTTRRRLTFRSAAKFRSEVDVTKELEAFLAKAKDAVQQFDPNI